MPASKQQKPAAIKRTRPKFVRDEIVWLQSSGTLAVIIERVWSGQGGKTLANNEGDVYTGWAYSLELVTEDRRYNGEFLPEHFLSKPGRRGNARHVQSWANCVWQPTIT